MVSGNMPKLLKKLKDNSLQKVHINLKNKNFQMDLCNT